MKTHKISRAEALDALTVKFLLSHIRKATQAKVEGVGTPHPYISSL